MKGRDHLKRCVYGWEDDIKLDLEDTDKEGGDWFLLPQDGDQWQAVVSMAMNVWWYIVQVMCLLA
jgi:hypothetical protein